MPSCARESRRTEIYTLSLHDALPIYLGDVRVASSIETPQPGQRERDGGDRTGARSAEHTSELQSLRHLVCRLVLEKAAAPRSTLFPCTTLFRSTSATCGSLRASKLHSRGSASATVATEPVQDRQSTRLNSSHLGISYAVLC